VSIGTPCACVCVRIPQLVSVCGYADASVCVCDCLCVGGARTDKDFKYIYYNSMNMALKTTMLEGRPTTLSREVMRLLTDLSDEFARYTQRP
jgi:hypothetical protein